MIMDTKIVIQQKRQKKEVARLEALKAKETDEEVIKYIDYQIRMCLSLWWKDYKMLAQKY